MLEPSAGTFARLLERYISQGVIARDESVLVQFAGSYDEDVCASVGLVNCTFANIAPGTHSTGSTTADRFDAHRMPQPDRTFDHVIGHAGLHHCSRPHEALHEMYRLARKTVMFVENQDSILMRAASKIGVVGWHEISAVKDGDYVSGGVDGSGVPNFVYRWTRREVTKALAAFDPAYDVPVEFHSEWNLGVDRVSSTTLRRRLRLSERQVARALALGHKALNSTASRQGNIFAAMIRKDMAKLHPWMASPTTMAQQYVEAVGKW